MSRSYKHNPWFTDRSKHGAKWQKKQANHRVRRYNKQLYNGNDYKRIYNSWEIRDYKWYEPKNSAIAYYEKCCKELRFYWYDITEDYPTLKIYLDKCWAHDFYWK